jgi:hypothetical protein
MKALSGIFNRRTFIRTSAAIATGIGAVPSLSQAAPVFQDNVSVIGPREGFSPHIGTLLSMMAWMRMVVISSVDRLSKEELDYLHDGKSNTIGAMLLHLAATERAYQGSTMNVNSDYKELGNINWDAAMHLGDEGRNVIKGNSIAFYKNVLTAVRNRTIEEMKTRDDKWLLDVASGSVSRPINNYCKWFHVCEHESNHNGQIKWIKGRMPGAKNFGE